MSSRYKKGIERELGHRIEGSRLDGWDHGCVEQQQREEMKTEVETVMNGECGWKSGNNGDSQFVGRKIGVEHSWGSDKQ